MSDLVKVAEALAAPAKAAIEKLSAGAGKIYEPTHLRRMAKASLDKDLIGKISESDLERFDLAARNRLAYRHLRQELNITRISDRAAKLLGSIDNTNAIPPDDEWVDEFTDQCSDSSADELQELWSRLFVEQTVNPNSIPRRILRVIRDVDVAIAKSFTLLLGCGVIADDARRVVLTYTDWESNTGLLHRNIRELEDVGLIVIPTLNSKINNGIYRFVDRLYQMTFQGDSLTVGLLQMTSAGIALARVAEARSNSQYLINLKKYVEASGGKMMQLQQV